jgi:RimJ/RimL family protein N-acetyltransferase
MPELVPLEGRFVHLLPLSLDHTAELVDAALDDRGSFTFTPVPWDEASMVSYLERALAEREAGHHLPYATWSVESRRIVGTTRFYDLTSWDWSSIASGAEDGWPTRRYDLASIGYTWLHPSAQRTRVNTEAKLLMMTEAFDEWNVVAMHMQTDARNARSRAAISRLGFTLDGVIRADKAGADGTVRDSAVFSMTAAEWPGHRARLVDRLAPGAG